MLDATQFTRVNLAVADFGESFMGSVVFGAVDLFAVAGSDTVTHGGPSVIGLGTIYLSKGNIPDHFLRGTGVPEPFIVQMRALVGAMSPIQFHSCFISYSSKDGEFAERLYHDLQLKGVRCWFAPADSRTGDRIRPKIDEAIRIHDKLLLILTENSVKSDWVEKEVETAFEKERNQGRTVLFPIRLDDTAMDTENAWAADIRRTRHIGDFREWKSAHEYKRALERLVHDLRA
jgi:hypothetical protein